MADFKSLDLRNVYCSPNLIEANTTHSHSFMGFSHPVVRLLGCRFIWKSGG